LGRVDALHTFADAMRSSGLMVDSVEPDGQIHRVRVEGERASKRNGWYVLFDGAVLAGCFGSWSTGFSQRWHATGPSPLTVADFATIEARVAEASKQRELEQAGAQQRAARIWNESTPADPYHAYLVAKNVLPHGCRQRHGLLIVPMRDSTGTLRSIQTIAEDGTKRYLKGARKKGLYFAIGGPVRDSLAICEGFATGASIHEASSAPVAIAFDAGNLEPVAIALRKKYPTVTIIVCADDDRATQARSGRNPGREAAERAARAIGGRLALPEFTQ
jgi:putative DNA primase/helicase